MSRYSNLTILRARKSAWFAVLLILAFALKNMLWPLLAPHPKTDLAERASVGVDSQPLVLCKSFVDGHPFGADSVFREGRDRVHAFSKIPGIAGTSHVWYHGGDSMASFPCSGHGSCMSFLPADSLRAGEWSVDLVIGRHLLASRQFRIEAK